MPRRKAVAGAKSRPRAMVLRAASLPAPMSAAISRRDQLGFPPCSVKSPNGDRAYLFDHQTRCDRAQSDRRDQRHDRAGGPADRRAEARAHHPRAGGNVLCRASRTAVLPRARRLHDFRAGGGAGARRRERDREISRHHGRDRSRRRRRPEPSARSTPNRSARTRCTARTRRTRRAKEIAQFFSGNEIVG